MGKLLRKKPLLSGLLMVVVLLTAVYMAYGHYIGKMVHEIVLSALMSGHYAEGNPYADMIADEDYNKMVILQPKYAEGQEISEAVRCGSPFVVHWFVGAEVWVKYECAYFVHSWPVTIRFSLDRQDGEWRVTELASHF